jgi:hypothetical protein
MLQCGRWISMILPHLSITQILLKKSMLHCTNDKADGSAGSVTVALVHIQYSKVRMKCAEILYL